MIHIITPVTRVSNLQKVADSLESSHTLKWWVLGDVNKFESPMEVFPKSIPSNVREIHVQLIGDGVAGHTMRNYVLNHIPYNFHDWIYSVDDDNILHPGFLDELIPGRDIVVVEQLYKDGTPRLDAKTIKLNHIDTAQYAYRRNIVGELRFEVDRYDADGVFIETLYNQYPEKFTLVHKPLSYYNYLR